MSKIKVFVFRKLSKMFFWFGRMANNMSQRCKYYCSPDKTKAVRAISGVFEGKPNEYNIDGPVEDGPLTTDLCRKLQDSNKMYGVK